MKTTHAILLAALLATGLPTAAHAAARSPLVGRWAVDTTRLPMAPAQRPKSVTIAFDEAPAGKWSIRVDIVDADGGKRHTDGISTLDGTPAPVRDNFEADIAATRMPVPGTLILQLGKDGRPGSTRVYTASADGQSMIETSAYYDQTGKPILRTHYFKRLR